MNASIAWKRICCPVDFSEEARAALSVAVDLCKRLGAELVLLFVRQAAPPTTTTPPAPDLSAWSEAASAEGVATTTTEVTGDPQIAIANFAERSGIDAVVMGTHGRTGRDRSMAGSVAEATVRTARCPVMVVHTAWEKLPP
jgi:nucleotide-binding universal stress UspA family protein